MPSKDRSLPNKVHLTIRIKDLSATIETMPVQLVVGEAVAQLAPADPRLERARPNFYRFLGLVAQLGLLLAVFRVYHVEQFNGPDDLGFFAMCCLAFAAFAVHYWLPFHLKEKFWVTLSVASAFLFLWWKVALALIVAGIAIYLILASRMSYWKRVGLVASGFAVAMVLRAFPAVLSRLTLGHSLNGFWQFLGALFMFRLIIYLHDLRHMKGRPRLVDYLAYFFVLPNYLFLLFPVIDYKTMRLGYYRRDIHEIAQQGIQWIARGTIQLLLYMVVFHVRDMLLLDGIHSFGSLVSLMFFTFLLYMRVSGQFHICVGLLHLFGYDLPETNHKYLFSNSLTDFWRRINIYWKDFMVKVVYFPAYFRLRKKGDFRARMTATALVFLVTWILHAYQTFWLSGSFAFSWTDTTFWGILGLLVMVNVWWEGRHAGRRQKAGILAHVRNAASVVCTLAVILTLWSLWDAPSLRAWVGLLAWWKPGAQTF